LRREDAAGEPLSKRVGDVITDSLRYWEPRRLVYNGVLLAVVAAHFIADFPRSRSAFRPEVFVFLFIMAVLANACYCAAYVADLFVQFSGFGRAWQRRRCCFWLWGRCSALQLPISSAWASSRSGDWPRPTAPRPRRSTCVVNPSCGADFSPRPRPERGQN
jgi:hypothetical protein